MTTYRDDTQDNGTAADTVWGGLSQTIEEAATIAETLIFSLLVLHASAATAADIVSEATIATCAESAVVGDAVIAAVTYSQTIKETATAADKTITTLQVLHTATATAADAVSEWPLTTVKETATAADLLLTQRDVTSVVAESATAADAALQAASVLVEEAGQLADTVIETVLTTETADDAVTIAEGWSDTLVAHARVCEAASGASTTSDHQAAVNTFADGAVAEDHATGGDGTGQAWTANNDTWAMSRYAPYAFRQLVVIAGSLYGVADDGIYALDGAASTVSGRIETGRLNLGGECLPTQALVAYAMDSTGNASMEVTTTQSGTPETYAYSLARGDGAAMKNGRFEFGRGLRGQHFSFALALTAKSATIEDLRIISAQSKRRV